MRILKFMFLAISLGFCFIPIGCERHFNGPTHYSEYENWQVTHLGGGKEFDCNAVAIGALKANDESRLYLLQRRHTESVCRVLECSFKDGKWLEDEIYSYPAMDSQAAIGQCRNDGVNRLYIAHDTAGMTSYTLQELSRDNGTWKSTEIECEAFRGGAITVGQGRNDGMNRIYCCGSEGDIYEYTFTGNSWDRETFGPGGEFPVDEIAIGAARNDGVNRVYAAGHNGVIYELSFTGAMWNIANLGTVKNEMYGNDVYIAVGQGRSDGLERVYTCVENLDAIYELSYRVQGEWVMDSTKVDFGGAGLSIGKGRNDNMYRIYRAGSFGHLQESSYLDEEWRHTADLRGTSYFRGVTIGKGRGDHVSRIYGLCTDGYVLEFSYQP